MMFSPSPLRRNGPKSAILKSVTCAFRVERTLTKDVYSTGRCGYASCQIFDNFGSRRTRACALVIVMLSPQTKSEAEEVEYISCAFWRNITSMRLSKLFGAALSVRRGTGRGHHEGRGVGTA